MTPEFHKRYKILDKIGEGTFSIVFKIESIDTNEKLAGKVIKQTFQNKTEAFSLQEIQILKSLSQHPNVINLIDVTCGPTTGRITLLFNLMDLSLHEYLRSRKRFLPESKAKIYLFQLTCGVQHLHSKRIFHRDIKPENIFLKFARNKPYPSNDVEVVQIGDLGSACSMDESPPHTAYISTRWYRAPECLLTSGYYGAKMDVWALGCVFYEMLTLTPLFPGDDDLDQLHKIHDVLGSPGQRTLARFRHVQMNYDFPKKNAIGLHKLLPILSEYGLDVLKRLLTYIPDLRITATSLLHHAYFNDLKRRMKSQNCSHSNACMRNMKANNSKVVSNSEVKVNSGVSDYEISTEVKHASKSISFTKLGSHSTSKFLEATLTKSEDLLKGRERAWGMKPGTVKSRLLNLNKIS